MIPIDYFVILGLVLIFSFVAFYFGKNRSISVTISLYLGILFFEKTPILQKLIIKDTSPLSNTLNQWAVYLLVSTILYLLISRHIHSFESDTSIFKSIVYGISMSIFIMSLSYFLIPSESIYNFSGQIDYLFVKDIGLYPYIFAPFLLLLLF